MPSAARNENWPSTPRRRKNRTIRRRMKRQRAVAARAAPDSRGCPVSLAARAVLASWAHRRTAGAVTAVPVPAAGGPPALVAPGRAGGDGGVRRAGGVQGGVEQGRLAGRGRAAALGRGARAGAARARGAAPAGAGAGGGGGSQGRAGQGYPGDHAAAGEQGGERDPHRPAPGLAAVAGQVCLQPRLLLPGVFMAGALAARRHAGAGPELLGGLVVAGVATSGPVEVIHGRHGAGRVCDIGQPKLGFPWESAACSPRARPLHLPGPGLSHIPGARPAARPGRARPGYIRSGTGIPSMPSPAVRIRSARAQSASLLSRSSGEGAPSTGHSS